MAIIHPFKGWLPKADKAAEISSVPYDVINSDEARELAEGKPESFLHVIRPEIDLPEDTSYSDDRVYETGAENLIDLLDGDSMDQDEEASLYIYQLEAWGRTQTGLFSCVAVEDYDNEVILKHELTRPDKENDRTRHIMTQAAHAEPVMMTFKDSAGITGIMNSVMESSEPAISFLSDDGVRHTIWKVVATDELVHAFSEIPNLYIADGHHRCKSASRVAEELRKKNNSAPGENEYDFFPAVLFPMDQMEILPYNRIIRDVRKDQIERLAEEFDMIASEEASPVEKGEVCVYSGSGWYLLKLPPAERGNVVDQLDVARLQQSVFSPIFGIKDPRTDSNIDFVGGIRGTDELEHLVNSGEASLAFSMFPTAIEELVNVSDQGELMPPKSTWFEPKLRSGLIIHTF